MSPGTAKSKRLLARLRAEPDTAPDAPAPGTDAPERILQTALEEITDNGLRRFTVDRLAKRVGLSRVTIYRHFPGKEGVLEALLLRELRSFMRQVGKVVAGYDTLEDRVVEGFIFALIWLRHHALLQRLLSSEPELILPLLTTQGAPVVEAARDFITGFARADQDGGFDALDPEQLQVLSEMLARVILSLTLTPDASVPLKTDPEIRAFAEQYVRPVVRMFAQNSAKQLPS